MRTSLGGKDKMDENINTDKLEDLILMALEAKIATDTGVLLEKRNNQRSSKRYSRQ